MGQGDVPTSRGGPLRRRKEKRQLEHLAASTARDGTPQASAAHVKLLGDPPAVAVQADHEAQEADGPDSSTPPPPPRTGGFHVRAVPIDQPVGD
jgi:hypothetical protein